MVKQSAIASLFLSLLISQASFAMYCGEHLIEGGQEQGMTMDEVKKLCGEPAEARNYGDDLVYEKEDGTYILHFNTEGILQSIEQPED